MERKPRYTIPVGTRVDIRDMANNGKLRQHVTRRELRFIDRTVTGYDGLIFYFEHGDWLIAVNADLFCPSQHFT